MTKFIKELDIDRNAIDRELLEQPQLYYEWAKKAADAEKETLEVKNDYEIIRGKKEKKIRANPSAYGLEPKPTKDAVKDEAFRSRLVQKYYKMYLKALANENTLKRAEKAFQQRKSMLQSYVQYDVRNYYADVKVPQTPQKNRWERQTGRKIRDGIKRQLKRKRKKK